MPFVSCKWCHMACAEAKTDSADWRSDSQSDESTAEYEYDDEHDSHKSF